MTRHRRENSGDLPFASASGRCLGLREVYDVVSSLTHPETDKSVSRRYSSIAYRSVIPAT